MYVNKALSFRNRQKLLPFLGWVKLALNGLYCLPLCPSTVYRGVRLSKKDQYRKGKRFLNWSFLSTTPSVRVINGVLGTKGNYTIFSIEATSLINISDFSLQEEFLLLPGTMLIVTEVLELANDVTIVHIKEDVTARPMLDLVHPELEDRRPPDTVCAAAATTAPSSPTPSVSTDEDPPCCRICFEEGDADNQLIIPCDCKGSMMYIHESCLFEWRAREKADKCNTCNSPYKTRQNICSGALYPRATFNEMNMMQNLEIKDSGYTLKKIKMSYSNNLCTCVSSTGISVPKDGDIVGFAKYRWCLRVHVTTKGALAIVNNLFNASKLSHLAKSYTSSADSVFPAGSIVEGEKDI